MTFKLGLRKFNADDGSNTFSGVFTLEISVGILNVLILSGIVVNDLCQRALKACKVRTAFYCRDVIRVGIDVLGEGIVILDSDLYEAFSASLSDLDRRLVKRLSVAV